MSEPGSSKSSTCFICGESLREGDVVLVKEKGVQTLRASSAALKNRDNECLLRRVTEICVHSACQKRYNHPKVIAAAVKRGETDVKGRTTRGSSEQFIFRENCFLCGERITAEFIEAQKRKRPDKRNSVITVEKMTLNKTILQAAEKRGDEWGMKIKERLTEDTDLVALDARYHLFCQRQLYRPVTTPGGSRGHRDFSSIDEAMECIYAYLETHGDECQFSLSQLIEEIKGEVPDRRTIKNRLFAKYGDDILIAEMKNKENVVCFKNTGYKVLTNEWYEQTSKLDPQQERMSVVRAAADIVREDIRSQVYNTSEFMPSNDFLQDVDSVIPETLKVFLETLILKQKRGILDVYRRKCVALAHSIIASVRPRSFVSSLLHGVGTYLYHKFGSRHVIDMLASLGFSASYSSTTVLESSAIMRPDKLELEGNAFIQFSFDNADFNINTVDGLGTFHAMGGIMMVTPYESIRPEGKIARLTTCSAIELVKRNPPVQLDSFQNVKNKGLSDIIIQNVDIINPLPDDINPLPSDVAWLFGKSLEVQQSSPGWSAFMEEVTKDISFQRTKVVCLPFINHPPSQYDTILTSLRMANEKCRAYRQKTCFVTFDQPLYIKAREILANCGDTDLNNVFVRLGGFHLLMSFMGTIGNIMAGSGLKELCATIYAENSVEKMMTGHSYARAVRAHTLAHLALAGEVVKTLNLTEREKLVVRDVLSDSNKSNILRAHENKEFQAIVQKFNDALQNLEKNGPTAKLWANYFRMVTLVKQFIQAERMGNWDLHLNTVQLMLPFFHAAGHFFYAKCAHLYLQNMLELSQKIDADEYKLFTADGFFTVRRSKKFWAGIWSDMTIEQVLMCSMKNYGGLTRGRGITETVLTRWTLGMIYLQNICADVEEFCNVEAPTSEQHVEMRPTRISRDEADTQKLSNWFSKHPPFCNTDVIMSLSSGLVGDQGVNCHMARDIGKTALMNVVGENFQNVKFKRKLKVVTLSSAVRSVNVGNKQVAVDPLTLFHRLCVLKQSDEEMQSFFNYELSPFPMSMFSQEGMRKGTKSSFYAAFTPVDIENTQGKSKFVVVDGGHLLHKVVWPKTSSFETVAARYVQYLDARYGQNVAVVFDGYPSEAEHKGTKSSERDRRAMAHSAPEVIFEENTIPQIPQDKFLSNDKNKLRLIQLLKRKMEKHGIQVIQSEEDADRLIVTTALVKASDYDLVIIAGEDIDLLVIFTGLVGPSRNVYFQKCGRGKTADVFYSAASTSSGNHHLIPFVHAFSGCDSTSAFFGHGKAKLLTALERNPQLKEQAAAFLNPTSTPVEIAAAGEQVIVTMYGGKPGLDTPNSLRYQLFAKAAAKTNFNLARLPPTADAAKLHSFRAYHQVQKWMGQDLSPTQWGWQLTPQGLVPKMMNQEAAPSQLLQIISCNCRKGCGNACSCKKAGLKCSIVCGQCSGQSCENIPEITIDFDEQTLDLDESFDDEELSLPRLSQFQDDVDDQDDDESPSEDDADDYVPDPPDTVVDNMGPGPSKRAKRC